MMTADDLQVILEGTERDVVKLRARVEELEDAITDAGILLCAGHATAAMRRLGRVMGPEVLKRQGI